jgi:hypothetical protein
MITHETPVSLTMDEQTSLFPECIEEPKPSRRPETIEEGRLVEYYVKRIRKHNYKERQGVVRKIKKLEETFTLEQIWTAVKNYEAVLPSDPKYLRHIHYFFTPETIKLYQTPGKKYRKSEPSPEMKRLEKIGEYLMAQPVKRQPPRPAPEPEDDEEDTFEL